MNIFFEGIESLKLACSLVLLVPAIGVALLGARTRWLAPLWVLVVSVVAWLRFATWWNLAPEGFVHSAAGAVVVGLAVAAWRFDRWPWDAAATAGVAVVAAWTWVPCVGEHLGDILNNARRSPWPELAPTFGYLTGLFVPLLLLAALPVAVPQIASVLHRPSVRLAGLAIIALIGVLVTITLFDDLAGELARRSSF